MASATVRLTRGAFEGQRHPFEILLDGTVVGSLSRRETVELPVEPGHHTRCDCVRADRSARCDRLMQQRQR